MQTLERTQLYQKALALTRAITEHASRIRNPYLSEKIQKEALTLITQITKGIHHLKEKTEPHDPYFRKSLENLQALVPLLTLAQNTNVLKAKRAQQLLDDLNPLKEALAGYPQKRKKILILSTCFGSGHRTAAFAIRDGLKHLYGEDYQVEVMDFTEIISKGAIKISQKFYDKTARLTPSFYKFLFEASDSRQKVKIFNIINYPFIANHIHEIFSQDNPDVIISTHPLWDYIINHIWKKYYKGSAFISIITDSISVHQAWVTSKHDYYIVSNQDTAESLYKYDVPKEKIKSLGFPLKLPFYQPTDRKEFLRSLGLNPKNFTLLLIANTAVSNSLIKIPEKIESHPNQQLIIITGKNDKLKEKLAKTKFKFPVKVIGWVDNMYDYMHCSDVIITKAGGATVMECVACQKPTIIPQVIPGQEEGNAELIQKHQLGFVLNRRVDVNTALQAIRGNYANIQRNFDQVTTPNATLKIAEFIKSLLEKR